MRVEQCEWGEEGGWSCVSSLRHGDVAQLVLVFGEREAFARADALASLQARYPAAEILGCSSAGQIFDRTSSSAPLVATAISFEATRVCCRDTALASTEDSHDAGERLAEKLCAAGEALSHVFVLSDGLRVNGSALVRGLAGALPAGVGITGGLSADGERFASTLLCLNGRTTEGMVAAAGFYGTRLKVGAGSLGGWDPFGPERLVTRSRGNVLLELDGRSALQLYRLYLGDHAAEMPASALLFPLSLRTANGARLVRTVLAVDDREASMTFAGDIPEGAYARLMKTSHERLIEGAAGAARASLDALGGPAELALLVSCVGRRLVLKQRTEEEVDSVRAVLGERAVLAGFYAYGEIAPAPPASFCELHNQTMTVTAFSER